MSRYGLHGSIRAHPGQRQALLEYLLEAATLMQSAPGCDLYAVSTVEADDHAVWVTEIWRSKADHDASLTLPGVSDLVGRARAAIAGMGDSQVLEVHGGPGRTD
ncbi:MAG TPA: putative quinol monooxygenase [Candidatus Limnocylindria bacterium]|nr:putative quinol monooxygenase [Candidatus Limnocylindria bacterium]